jgi:hypothetical protein
VRGKRARPRRDAARVVHAHVHAHVQVHVHVQNRELPRADFAGGFSEACDDDDDDDHDDEEEEGGHHTGQPEHALHPLCGERGA